MRLVSRPAAGAGNRPRRPASRILAVVTAAAGIALAGPAVSAEAHPQGPPQQVTLNLAAPDQVRLVWRPGANDDLSWLAYDLGLLPDDRIMLDGAIVPEDGDAALLEASSAFPDYLTRQTAVRVQGQSCSAEVTDTHDLANAGASLIFSCPTVVTQATVELHLLTDLEPSYATIVTGPDGRQAAYNGNATSHDWAFDPGVVVPEVADAPSGPSWSLLLAAAIGLPALAGGSIWLLRRRGHDRRAG